MREIIQANNIRLPQLPHYQEYAYDEANKQLVLGEIARFAYQLACKASPMDKNLWTMLADHLEQRGEYSEAVKVWEQICKLDPQDLNAVRKITTIQTKETTHRGGYEDAENTRDVMAVKGGGPARAGEAVAPGQSKEADLRHAVRREPERIENYLKLASHLKETKQFEAAYETMQKALEVSGDDPNVREQVEDYEILLMKYNVDQAKEQAGQAGTDEARKQAAALSIQLRDRQIEVLSARVERYPANLNIKLDLALLLMQLQKWAQAIPLLQRASQDPRLMTKALVALGKCFVYDKKLPLARGQFERAIPGLNPNAQPETFKECHYLLARVCEELGDQPAAEKHFGEVLVIDYEYKDARERLEKLQGG
jgi:tetratricopeptide (TPR) repeat protein